MPLKSILMVTILLMLNSCGTGSSKDAITIDNNPLSSVNIPKNSGSDHYKIIIYGNSHSSQLGGLLEILISSHLPNVTVETKTISGTFLDEIVSLNSNVDILNEQNWSHTIIQGQKYSQSGIVDYPTNAAQRLIKTAKSSDITPILFPEHPQRGDANEGRRVYELHMAISAQQPSCVAPIGLVWDRLLAVMPDAPLYERDGNHAAYAGKVLTAMAFYEIITAELADMMPFNPKLNISEHEQTVYAQIVTEVLKQYRACPENE